MANKQIAKSTFISPKKVLAEVGLGVGDTVIDFASGAGHWTLAAAKIVGASGSVLAIENSESMLELVQGVATQQGLANVLTEMVDITKEYHGEAAPAKLVIVANILYLIKDKKSFVSSVARLVAADGRLLFIDWSKGSTLFGPKATARMTEEQVITLFEKAGLNLVCSVDAGEHHYGLVFDRKSEKKNDKE